MTVQIITSTYSAQRDESAGCIDSEVIFCSLTRGSNSDSRHVKGGLLAQQRRRKYAGSLPRILQPRSGPSSQRVADFLRHLAPS